MRIFNDTIADGLDMSGDATSDVITLDHIEGFAVQCSWTGVGINGSLILEASNDQTTWDELDSVAIDGPATHMWNVAQAYFRYARVRFDHSANSGSLTARVNAKGL